MRRPTPSPKPPAASQGRHREQLVLKPFLTREAKPGSNSRLPGSDRALFTYMRCVATQRRRTSIGRRGRRPDWMDEMGKQRKAFSVCIGNYGYYAEGELRDRRIALPASRAEFRDFLEKSGLQDPMHEEIYVSDYESVPFGLNSLFGENREYRPA